MTKAGLVRAPGKKIAPWGLLLGHLYILKIFCLCDPASEQRVKDADDKSRSLYIIERCTEVPKKSMTKVKT